jgi:hypothetical protein
MATTYKTLLNDDVVSTRTLLHESIPITGSLVAGTYNDENVKNFSHGRFQSVYDYPYLSSSANHIFDLSCGYSSDSALSGASNTVDQSKKIQMYNQLSQVLVGHDVTGSILKFDEDGNIVAGGTKLNECVFFSFSRLLVKDEIKKNTVRISLGTGTYSDPFSSLKTIGDYGANNDYRVNSPAGEYGILHSSSVSSAPCGLVFYQAGILAITASVFAGTSQFLQSGSTDQSVSEALSGSSIQDFSDAVRSRIQDIDFNNTVELNSTVYFCRMNHNEFNYSANPTYLQDSKIRVKESSVDSPVSYITTVGLYSSDNELLATAKLSEPLKKTPENELILRVRLDY